MKQSQRNITCRSTRPARILAIDPGTRAMGVAFFVGTELIRTDVESIRTPGMEARDVVGKAEAVLRRWIARYRPVVIAIEEPHFAQSRQSATLRRLTIALARLAARKSIVVRRYLPTTVRRVVCRDHRPTRLAVARVIATERFPWLHRFYEKEAKKSWWRKRYWTSMFDAVALGLAAIEDGKRAAAGRSTFHRSQRNLSLPPTRQPVATKHKKPPLERRPLSTRRGGK